MFSSDAVCLGYGQIFSLRSARCSHTCTPALAVWLVNFEYFCVSSPVGKYGTPYFFSLKLPIHPPFSTRLTSSRQEFGSAWRTSSRGCKCPKPCRRVFVKSSFDVQISRWERLRLFTPYGWWWWWWWEDIDVIRVYSLNLYNLDPLGLYVSNVSSAWQPLQKRPSIGSVNISGQLWMCLNHPRPKKSIISFYHPG